MKEEEESKIQADINSKQTPRASVFGIKLIKRNSGEMIKAF